MSSLTPSEKQAFDQERSEVLRQWDAWLETPLLVLGFAWLGLFIIELVWGLNPLLVAIGITIWLIFMVDFGVKLLLAPRKLPYLKHCKTWVWLFRSSILDKDETLLKRVANLPKQIGLMPLS